METAVVRKLIKNAPLYVCFVKKFLALTVLTVLRLKKKNSSVLYVIGDVERSTPIKKRSMYPWNEH